MFKKLGIATLLSVAAMGAGAAGAQAGEVCVPGPLCVPGIPNQVHDVVEGTDDLATGLVCRGTRESGQVRPISGGSSARATFGPLYFECAQADWAKGTCAAHGGRVMTVGIGSTPVVGTTRRYFDRCAPGGASRRSEVHVGGEPVLRTGY